MRPVCIGTGKPETLNRGQVKQKYPVINTTIEKSN